MMMQSLSIMGQNDEVDPENDGTLIGDDIREIMVN